METTQRFKLGAQTYTVNDAFAVCVASERRDAMHGVRSVWKTRYLLPPSENTRSSLDTAVSKHGSWLDSAAMSDSDDEEEEEEDSDSCANRGVLVIVAPVSRVPSTPATIPPPSMEASALAIARCLAHAKSCVTRCRKATSTSDRVVSLNTAVRDPLIASS